MHALYSRCAIVLAAVCVASSAGMVPAVAALVSGLAWVLNSELLGD